MGKNVYRMITNEILNIMEKGVVPWNASWIGGGMPYNLFSKKPYRGINILLLGSARYTSKYWCTFRQAKELGGQVKKGEKGTQIIFWKFFEKEEISQKTGLIETIQFPMLRYYTVFNLNQINGIEEPEKETVNINEPIEDAEKIFQSMPNRPKIERGKTPCYSPSSDVVGLPHIQDFISSERQYKTTFHELIHSTGHSSRLNRDTIMNFNAFGSHEYSKEELIAEFGAAFLCAMAGIVEPVIDNSAAYIDGWSKVFQKDEKIIVCAAAAAQKAADYILNASFD